VHRTRERDRVHRERESAFAREREIYLAMISAPEPLVTLVNLRSGVRPMRYTYINMESIERVRERERERERERDEYVLMHIYRKREITWQ